MTHRTGQFTSSAVFYAHALGAILIGLLQNHSIGHILIHLDLAAISAIGAGFKGIPGTGFDAGPVTGIAW